MASRKHDSTKPSAGTRRLIERFLDPSGDWDARSQNRLQERLASNPADQSLYRREMIAHRLMVGGDSRQPSALEDQRRMDALLDTFAVTESQTTKQEENAGVSWSWGRWFGGFITGCAAIVVAITTQVAPQQHQPWRALPDYQLSARGGESSHDALVGFGVTGVTETGLEYEVLSAGEIFRSDFMRFSYTNKRAADVEHLFLFGLQKTASGLVSVRWYAPEPSYGESQSIRAPQAQARAFDFETRLSTQHTLGPLRFIGVFSKAPIELGTVQHAVQDLMTSDAFSPSRDSVETWLRGRLGLMPGSHVQIEDTNVVPGSHTRNPSGVK